MSTKSTIYYQEPNDEGEADLHIYWDMGSHMPDGVYVDLGYDLVKIKDPLQLAHKLLNFLQRAEKANATRSKS